MQDVLSEFKVKELEKFNGIKFFHIPSLKFKTSCIDIFFVVPLEKESAPLNAIWTSMLKRGCKKYPSQRDIALRLEELYGASLSINVSKKGENQIIHIHSDQVSDKYTSGKTNIFRGVFELLVEILKNPLTQGEAFLEEAFKQERTNLIGRIKSRVNNKMQYAVMRCMEEMCKGEPYEVYELGDIDTVNNITPSEAYRAYKSVLKKAPVFVYLSGDIDDLSMKMLIDEMSTLERNLLEYSYLSDVSVQVKETKVIEEKMDVNQGKLSLGFRTGIRADSLQYYPLVVYNGILGGGIHSKLFQNVRERESLAYYAFSRLEKFKGLMVVSSGIEIDNYKKALDVIKKQVDEILKGNITDYEMDATKKTFFSGLKSMQDSQLSIVDFFFSQHLAGISENFESLYEKIAEVTKDDVIKAAKSIRLDTIYFLTSKTQQGI